MERKSSAIDQQNQVVFDLLKGEEKMNFFVGVFVGNLISAMKSERKSMNLTQEELAKKMCVKQAYVSKIEQLEKIPTIETIGKYLFALDYSLEEIPVICKFLVSNDNLVASYNFNEIIGKVQKDKAFGGFTPVTTAVAYSGRY